MFFNQQLSLFNADICKNWFAELQKQFCYWNIIQAVPMRFYGVFCEFIAFEDFDRRGGGGVWRAV